jgi:hypothetical protein
MSHNCSKCGRECKDKRGLSIHEKKCGHALSNQEFICEHCDQTFTTHYGYKKHMTRCKVLKEHEEKEQQEVDYKINLLKKDAAHTNAINLIQYEMNRTVESLEHQIIKLKYESEQRRLIEINELKQKYESQLILRDNDVTSFSNMIKTKDEDIQVLKHKIAELEQDLKNGRIEEIKIRDEALYFARMNSQQKNQYTNVNNNNNVYIQVFDPSFFQGHINPPDDMAVTTTQLVNLLFDKGLGNFLRITDKSRNVAMWNKPGEGLIKDPQCKKLVECMTDSLQKDFIKQKAWLTEKIRYLESLPESNVSRYYSQLDFTNSVIDKSEHLLEALKKQIGGRAKDKNDSSIDPIVVRTYEKFTMAFYGFFTFKLSTFVFKSVYDIGKQFSTECHSLYHTEGGSKEKQFIILLDDSNEAHICNESMLHSILQDRLEKIFESSLQDYINQWIGLVNDHSKKEIPFIDDYKKGTFVSELLRGLIDVRLYK